MYPMHLVGFYLTLLSFGTLSLCKLCVHAWTEGEQEPLLKCHAYQYQQQTFEQTTSSFLLPDEIVVADCSSNGHWPLTKSCKSSHSGIFFDPDTQALFSTGSITPDGKPSSCILCSSNMEYFHRNYLFCNMCCFCTPCYLHAHRL